MASEWYQLTVSQVVLVVHDVSRLSQALSTKWNSLQVSAGYTNVDKQKLLVGSWPTRSRDETRRLRIMRLIRIACTILCILKRGIIKLYHYSVYTKWMILAHRMSRVVLCKIHVINCKSNRCHRILTYWWRKRNDIEDRNGCLDMWIAWQWAEYRTHQVDKCNRWYLPTNKFDMMKNKWNSYRLPPSL